MSYIFNRKYRELSQEEQDDLDKIKDEAEKLFNFINELQTNKDCREYSLAKTKVEEAVMWAVKGLVG